MLGSMKDWILSIITLVLFITLIEILMPSSRMKKYASLVTGFVLIIAIINPFLKLVTGKVSLNDLTASNSSSIDRLEIEKDSKLLKEEQMKQIVEVYRKKIIAQLEQSAVDTKGVAGAKADVIINEDYNSDRFGEIKRAYLEISPDNGTAEIKPVSRVEKVQIGEEVNPEVEKDELDPDLKKRLEDRIGSLYSVDRENIVISRQKK